jgi:hypothetical protein
MTLAFTTPDITILGKITLRIMTISITIVCDFFQGQADRCFSIGLTILGIPGCPNKKIM